MTDALNGFEREETLERVEGAAAAIDAALSGLSSLEVYAALTRAGRVPPGRAGFMQNGVPPAGDAGDAGSVRSERTGIPRIPRLPWDEFFMLHAALAATRSTCDRGPELLLDPGRHGVGAVFVREKRIIAGGYNGSPPGQPHCDSLECLECEAYFSPGNLEKLSTCPQCGTQNALLGGHIMRNGSCVRTLHAEENALIQCALDEKTPAGATVYTTASPCWDCSKRLVRAGIARLVYGELYDSRYGLSADAKNLLAEARIDVRHLNLAHELRRLRDVCK